MTYIDTLDIGCPRCGATYTAAESHTCDRRRDAGRVLAHSYADELLPKYEWEPYTFHWTHVIRFVIGIALVYGLFVALIVIGTAAS